MFVLGIVAAHHGWLDPVPDRIRRACGFAALGAIAMFLLVAAIVASGGIDGDVIYDRGLHWPSLSLAALEGPLAVGTTVWLLAGAQRDAWNRHPRARSGHARSAYGAFLLSGLPHRPNDRAATDRRSRRHSRPSPWHASV